MEMIPDTSYFNKHNSGSTSKEHSTDAQYLLCVIRQ